MKVKHRKHLEYSESALFGCMNIKHLLERDCTKVASILWEGYDVARLCSTLYFTGMSFVDNTEDHYIEMSVRYDRFRGKIVIKYLEQVKD